jgi:hypothetical protein
MKKLNTSHKNSIIDKIKLHNTHEYHMTQLNYERVIHNINSVEHVIHNNIDGDIVEIGVWRGGSILSMILTLEELGITDRTIRLYDTFSGMTEPTDIDIFYNGKSALEFTQERYKTNDISVMNYVPIEEVQNNISSNSSYPSENITYHKGDIIHTDYIPEKISLLRLDTDWYESTKFELDNFYDRVSTGGVIIIDDYNCWKGAKKATDEFINERNLRINLIDCTGGAVLFYKP